MLYKEILLIDDDSDDQEIFSAALGVVSDKVVLNTMNTGTDALKQLITKR